MKQTKIILMLAAVCAAGIACQAPLAGGDDTALADAKAAGLMRALVTARATGDYAAVEAILAADDVDGRLRAVLAAHGELPGAAPSASFLIGGGGDPIPLPPYSPDVYANGDVMVCKGSGTFVSEMMRQMLVRGYGHSGILNADLAALGADNCILSSDADYISGGGEALNYESLLDWAENDIVTVMRPTPETAALIPDIAVNIDAVDDNCDGGTVYAFLGYAGTPYGSFQPIPRADNDYWYCSKVPWRVYSDAAVDVEDAVFYDEAYQGAQRWTPFRESLLYQTYSVYLFFCYPFKSGSWRKARADSHLRSVLATLVSPDELRASPRLARQFTVTADGVFTGSALDDAAPVGWTIQY